MEQDARDAVLTIGMAAATTWIEVLEANGAQDIEAGARMGQHNTARGAERARKIMGAME